MFASMDIHLALLCPLPCAISLFLSLTINLLHACKAVYSLLTCVYVYLCTAPVAYMWLFNVHDPNASHMRSIKSLLCVYTFADLTPHSYFMCMICCYCYFSMPTCPYSPLTSFYYLHVSPVHLSFWAFSYNLDNLNSCELLE